MAMYEDAIVIRIRDKSAGISFIEMTMTREQWVNATMNRLAGCSVKSAEVRGLDLVGKTAERKILEFEIPEFRDREYAIKNVHIHCPGGWTADDDFDSQDSFFEKDDKNYARTSVRRWV
jgi:hypothetical protein